MRILNGNIAGLLAAAREASTRAAIRRAFRPGGGRETKGVQPDWGIATASARDPPIADLETGKVSLCTASEAGLGAPVHRGQRPRRAVLRHPPTAGGNPRGAGGRSPKTPDHAAETLAILGDHEAADSFAVDWFDDDEIAESEKVVDGLSAADLAKRDAAQMPAAASIRQAARSMPEPHAAHPIRWRSSDETPPGSLLPPPRGTTGPARRRRLRWSCW